jgi:hypothetical protein
MRGLLVIIGLFAFQPMALACSDGEWGQTQNDLSFAIENDANAKFCVHGEVSRGSTYFDAVLYCNSNADTDRIKRCAPEACNWLKARNKNPAC